MVEQYVLDNYIYMWLQCMCCVLHWLYLVYLCPILLYKIIKSHAKILDIWKIFFVSSTTELVVENQSVCRWNRVVYRSKPFLDSRSLEIKIWTKNRAVFTKSVTSGFWVQNVFSIFVANLQSEGRHNGSSVEPCN
jgi:hypothetical protein